MGADQQSGVPNISGTVEREVWHGHDFNVTSGPFYATPFYDKIPMGGGGAQEGATLYFNAARCSTVYQDNLTEARPTNIVGRYILKY